MDKKNVSPLAGETCQLCLLESNEKVLLEKVNLKHLRQKHPYIKSIKAYRQLCEHLGKVELDFDEEKKSISVFLKTFAKYLGSFLTSVGASLIAAYLFIRYYRKENGVKIKIDKLLKIMKKYQKLGSNVVDSKSFSKIILFLKNLDGKRYSKATDFLKGIAQVDISIISKKSEKSPPLAINREKFLEFFSHTFSFYFIDYLIVENLSDDESLKNYEKFQSMKIKVYWKKSKSNSFTKKYPEIFDRFIFYFSSEEIIFLKIYRSLFW